MIKLAVFLAVILLLIFFNWRGSLAGPKNLVYLAASPFLKLFQAVDRGLSGSWNFFMTLKDLNRENAELKNQNSELLGELVEMKETVRENESLRQQLGLASVGAKNLVLAEVTGYNPVQGQYFLIDKGLAAGLTEGAAVVAAGNFLVGRVVEVGKNYSKVILISDSASSVSAMTQNTRINGIVRGSHGLGLAMEMVPIDAPIENGEMVLSAGLNDGLPKNLVIGKVESVSKKESDIFQKALISPAVAVDQLKQVFVYLQ